MGYDLRISFNHKYAWSYDLKQQLIRKFYEYYYRRTLFSELLDTEYNTINVIANPHVSSGFFKFEPANHITIELVNDMRFVDEPRNSAIPSCRIHVNFRFEHNKVQSFDSITAIVFDGDGLLVLVQL